MKHLFRNLKSILFCLILAGYGAVFAQAAPPQKVNFQGRLTDLSDNPLNGAFDLTFSLYDAATAGTALWTETQTGVSVTNGAMEAILGSVTPIPYSVTASAAIYLEIQVGSEILSPRQPFNSVLYAMNTYQLAGKTYDAFVDTSTAQTITGTKTFANGLLVSQGNVGIGTTSQGNNKLTVAANPGAGFTDSHLNLMSSGTGWNLYLGSTATDDLFYIIGDADASANWDMKIGIDGGIPGNYGKLHFMTGPDGATTERMTIDSVGNVGIGITNPMALFQVGGGSLTVLSSGSVGIGTGNPGAKLEVAGDIKITGGSPGVGKVLTSGASGLASWQTVSGDNLGDHTAGTSLDMANFPINNVSTITVTNTITATDFIGNGSGLTGITGDNLGDHTATQQLNMGIYAIWSSSAITAANFYGNGSGLTGITGDNLGNHTATQVLQMGVYGINSTGDITAARYQINGSTMVAILPGADSIAYGVGAGANNITGGNYNVFIGNYAGASNTTGANNTANGNSALRSNTTGIQNTANGSGALYSNTGGYENTANGFYALYSNTTGVNNTANGSAALWANTTGVQNTANGYGALYANTAGALNTANGFYALRYNQTGSANSVIGSYAGGFGAGAVNSFSSSTIMGSYAGYGLTTGSDNLLLGFQSGNSLTTGARNIIIGYDEDAPTATTNDYLNIGGTIVGDMAASSVTVLGNLYANKFYGDGSALTSVTASGAVLKTGDTMTGSLALLNSSTLTVTGNAFSVGGSTLVVTSGNVGVGTAAPGQNATASFGRIMHIYDATSGVYPGIFIEDVDTPGARWFMHAHGDGRNSFAIRDDVNGFEPLYIEGSDTGIGTDDVTPAARLHVSSETPTATSNVLLVSTGIPSAPESLLVVKGNGDVGIGTASPGAKLEVAGEVKITGGSPGAGKVLTSDAVGLAVWQTAFSDNLGDHIATQALDMNTQQIFGVSTLTVTGNAFSVGGSTLVVTSGNVGIGTTAPEANLDVAGTAHLRGSSMGPGLWVDGQGVGIGTITPGSKFEVVGGSATFRGSNTNEAIAGFFNDSGLYAMIVSTTGNVGIGTVGAPESKLSVSGGASIGSLYAMMPAPSDGMIIAGNVGIGTTTPNALLHIDLPSATGSDNMITISTGPGNVIFEVTGIGEVYAEKYFGDGSALTGITGDDLGNHIATTTLQMGAYGINTSSSITAARYQINGSTMVAILPGIDSIAYGIGAGASNITGGDYNVFIGNYAGTSNTTGASNTANGSYALFENTTGGYNTANGFAALYANTTGAGNTANGSYALNVNTTGDNNTANGYYALFENATGAGNTANGYYALRNNQTGSANSVIGSYAGGFSAGGVNSFSSSTIMGSYAGDGLTTGSDNLLLGFQSGNSLTTGARNIIIGYDEDAPSATTNDYLNIGGVIYGDLSAGKVGIGTTSPGSRFEVIGGSATFRGSNTNEAIAGFFNDSGLYAMIVSTTGNVGIGMVGAPESRLGVSGGASIGSSYASFPAPSDGMIISGNVGIGTESPEGKLSVQGMGTNNVLFVSTDTNGVSANFVVDNAGNVGIGTESPGAKLDVRGVDTQAYNLAVGTSTAYSMVVSTSGNVGIGTTDPGENKLRVEGEARVGMLTTDSSAYLATLGGNVGIGTESPDEKLTVSGGNVKISSSTTSTDSMCFLGAVDALPATGYARGCLAYLITDPTMIYISTETVVGTYSWLAK